MTSYSCSQENGVGGNYVDYLTACLLTLSMCVFHVEKTKNKVRVVRYQCNDGEQELKFILSCARIIK